MKSSIHYLKKHILSKHNILLEVVLILVNLALLLLLSISINMISAKNSIYNHNLLSRTLDVIAVNKIDYSSILSSKESIIILDEEDESLYDNLRDIEHIELITSAKYGYPLQGYTKDFEKNSNGNVQIRALYYDDNIDIVKGKKISSSKEAICGDNFFPFYENNNSSNIIADDIIGKTIHSISEDYENKILDFKIVGLFNSKLNNIENNVCYISTTDYDELASVYNNTSNYIDSESGVVKTVKIPWSGKLVVVDNVKNVKKIISKLRNLNYDVEPFTNLEDSAFQITIYGPIVLSIIISLLLLIIIYSFISKKIKRNGKNYAILYVLGYSSKKITKINNLELATLTTISFVVSFIIYYFVFNLIKYHTAFNELLYNGLDFKIPIFLICLVFIFTHCLIIVVNSILLNKKLNKRISEIMSYE